MTPTEVTAILRQFNEWRRGGDIEQPGPLAVGEAIDAAVEMIDRLEAAESEAIEQARLNGMGSEREATLMADLEAAERERDALRAEIEAMEQQEPVAWRTFDGEGGYDFRSYEWNENYKLGWDARNPNHAGWVEPLYALPGAQPAPSVPEGCIQRGMAELEAIRSRQDDDTLLDDRTLIERIGKAMLAAAQEAKP